MKNPYDVLGVAQDASPPQIRAAYKSLVKKLHPDLHPDSPDRDREVEHLKQANAAYDLLRKGFTAKPQGRQAVEHGTAGRSAKTARGGAESARPSSTTAETAEVASARFWEAYQRMQRDKM